jgi:coenzyme F420-reducing hydrogenase alpha subunit
LFNYTSSRTIKNVKITTAASNINEIIQNREEMKQQFYCKKQQNFIKANKLLEKYYKLEKNVINEYNDNAFNHKKYQTVNPRSYVVESLNDSSFFRPIGKAFKKPDILRIAGIDGCNISDINELGVVTE